LSYDLWKSYLRDDEEKIYGSNCKDDYCKATDFARVTTLLALLLTVVAAGGLWRYQRSQDAEARAKRFERCCGLLAVGGFAGLVGASNYSVAMAAAVQDWDKDALDNDYTKTCAAGCALSLSFGLIAMVTGAAAVFLQRKYAKVPAGERQGSVKSIHMRTGDLVDQVQFEYRSGLSRTWGRGGGGGRPSFHLQDDEYLYSIEYCQNNTNLFGICFETNKGRKSQWYGNRSRSSSTLHAAAGQMIVGLKRGGGYCEKIKGIEEEPVATVFDRLVGVSQDWLHDGKNRNGEFILLGNGTCIGCGSRGASNKWKVTGDRTITATFHGVTHFIEYSPDLRSATIVNPQRSPLTRIRAEPMPVTAAEAPAAPLAEEEA
jgi:hypothetical protein